LFSADDIGNALPLGDNPAGLIHGTVLMIAEGPWATAWH
jgi:hypothetical protein